MRNRVTLIISFILAAFLSGNALGGKNIRGYKDVLYPDFALEDLIDTERESFSGALELCASGDSLGCRSKIVSVIVEEGLQGRFEPWQPRIDALARAGRFLNDEYILGIHKGFELTEDLDWTESPSESNNWEFNLLALDILSNATEAYRRTGERKYLDKCKNLILDFIDDNFDHMDLPSRYSWYDHSVSNRTIHSIDFWHEWLKLDNPDMDFAAVFLEFIWRHALYLENDRYYQRKTNHGMFANIALLRLATAFPQFAEARRWKDLAIERMEKQLSENYTDDMIHKEYSPSYHILTTKLLFQFRRDCDAAEDAALSASFDSLITVARSNIVWMIHPDGLLSLIGDSSLNASIDMLLAGWAEDDPSVRWVLTSGKDGAPPEKDSVGFTDAQLFVMRSGWGKKSHFRDESYLIADFCPYGAAHQQDDFLSFELSALGVRWFTDLGVFNYDDSDPKRRYALSPMAHNVIVPYNEIRIPVHQPETYPVQKAAEMDTDQVKSMFDFVESIEEPYARIDALLQSLDKGLGKLEPRALLILALSYEELAGNEDKERECLQKIIALGDETDCYDVAVQLLETLDIEDGEFPFEDDISDETLSSDEMKPEERAPVAFEQRMKPVLREKTQHKSREKRPEAETSPAVRIVRPNHRQTPRINFWVEDEKYYYLEGSFRYSSNFEHGRALLFIKPRIFVLVDKMKSSGGSSFRQLFHLPPSVSVISSETGFLLSGPGGEKCEFAIISAPPDIKSTLIEGQSKPELQGWYSGTFDNFEPAPVIEYSFGPQDRSINYIVHIVLPAETGNTDDYSFKVSGSPDSGGWLPDGREPLKLVVEDPDSITTISFSPSSLFTYGSSSEEAAEPVIEVYRVTR